MSGYGDSVEIDILSPKSCGIVGSILLVASLFLPIVTLKMDLLGQTEKESIYWKDSILNIVAVVVIILFYMLALWTESKWFMLIVAIGHARQVYQMVKNYNEVRDRLSGLNQMLGDSVFKVNAGVGMFCFIGSMIFMVIGIILAYREY